MARGNPAMKSKRVTGPTPNTEMLTRIREQEMRLGGSFVFNPRTGKRRVFGIHIDAPRRDVPIGTVVTIHNDHYH